MQVEATKNNGSNFGVKKCACEICKETPKAQKIAEVQFDNDLLEDEVQFESKAETPTKSKRSKFLKPALVLATATSILGALTLISKGKTGTGRISKFLKKEAFGEKLFAVENFNMFKPKTYVNLVKKMKYGPLDIITMGGSSVVSGLAVGCVLDDKKNRKAKVKESISQIVGNIICPILCVTGASVLMSKGIEKQLPVIKQITDKVGKRAPKVVASVLGFLAGVVGGNKVANKVNKTAFNLTEATSKRGIKASDLPGNIDDGCTTAALAGKDLKACEAVARVIPAALTIAGISTGLAKEKEE